MFTYVIYRLGILCLHILHTAIRSCISELENITLKDSVFVISRFYFTLFRCVSIVYALFSWI
jgi:hypothetical protein